jgi:F0F1-type ATP synthase assembly protein I
MNRPDSDVAGLYVLAAGVAGQVGCLLTVVIGGTVLLGLLFDELLGTKPVFLFSFLLGSIPLNLWAVYRYTRYKTRSLQAAMQKEESISED